MADGWIVCDLPMIQVSVSRSNAWTDPNGRSLLIAYVGDSRFES
jgi:hypothetical protein